VRAGARLLTVTHLPDLVVKAKLLDGLDEDLIHVAQHLEAVALSDVALGLGWWKAEGGVRKVVPGCERGQQEEAQGSPKPQVRAAPDAPAAGARAHQDAHAHAGAGEGVALDEGLGHAQQPPNGAHLPGE
jgi:hypothetical protein